MSSRRLEIKLKGNSGSLRIQTKFIKMGRTRGIYRWCALLQGLCRAVSCGCEDSPTLRCLAGNNLSTIIVEISISKEKSDQISNLCCHSFWGAKTRTEVFYSLYSIRTIGLVAKLTKYFCFYEHFLLLLEK
jgi:hypothetical protein